MHADVLLYNSDMLKWHTTSAAETDVWQLLLDFANEEFVYSLITKREQTLSPDRHKANRQKQARQIRTCILQAREYFTAARVTSSITAPNHLYYGAVSLASATMMLRGDGSRSLDALRATPSNRHHGIAFT